MFIPSITYLIKTLDHFSGHRLDRDSWLCTFLPTDLLYKFENLPAVYSHTDPLFKRNNIVKVSDLYQLQVFSFMYDLVNNKLPGSFDDFIPITNESNYVITTRQCNRLYMTRPRTTFSSNLPNHNFANIWNEFDQIYKKCEPKNKAKKLLRKQFINSYLNTVRCHNPMCDECNNNNN